MAPPRRSIYDSGTHQIMRALLRTNMLQAGTNPPHGGGGGGRPQGMWGHSRHSLEIKIRCSYIISTCILSFACSYLLSDRILQIFAIPLEDVYYRAQLCPSPDVGPHAPLCAPQVGAQDKVRGFHLIFTEITEAFISHICASAIITFYFCALPIFFYHLFMFLKPGLYRHEKLRLVGVIYASIMLSLAGLAFTAYILLPAGCTFFTSFESSLPGSMEIHMETRVSAYFGWVVGWASRAHLVFHAPLWHGHV
jgi:Sec-independent protein secretion pathway component TatC